MSSSQKDWLESVSEQRELVVHDDPEVVEEPRLGFLLDHGREEAKLEAGQLRGTIDGEEVGFPSLAHRDVLRLSFDDVWQEVVAEIHLESAERREALGSLVGGELQGRQDHPAVLAGRDPAARAMLM